jgi:hypothetical protein
MRRQGVAIGVYEIGPANKAGLRSLILIGPKAETAAQKLPRYVQRRKLAGGIIAYYWCRPWWARGEDCPPRNEALGTHLDKMRERAEVLNTQLDAWRVARKS